ncbi:MAG TPA: acyl-CoA thioesterase [Paenibacillaceae bacterium]|nr:acyl-CoA thioesterase [Paenibacillaceae bacterium]
MGKHSYFLKVNWGDTDAAGIVFFPNFYKWIDTAGHEFFGSIGYPSSKLYTEEKIGLPLLETHCEFKSPAFFEDEIELVTKVLEVGNKVIRLSHEFYRGDTLLAKGYVVRAWTNFAVEPIKAVPIPDSIRQVLEGLMESADQRVKG